MVTTGVTVKLLFADDAKLYSVFGDTLTSDCLQFCLTPISDWSNNWQLQLDGCIVWNAHTTVLGKEALLIYIVPVCYVKTGRYGKNLVISLLVYTGKNLSIITNISLIIS